MSNEENRVSCILDMCFNLGINDVIALLGVSAFRASLNIRILIDTYQNCMQF
jgi:hypothetical protein